MNAIQRYHYDRLQDYLRHLQRESEILQLPVEHVKEIIEIEERLKQLYGNYQSSLLRVAELIKQYEQEHRSVKRLMSSHKNHRKNNQKKIICKEIV